MNPSNEYATMPNMSECFATSMGRVRAFFNTRRNGQTGLSISLKAGARQQTQLESRFRILGHALKQSIADIPTLLYLSKLLIRIVASRTPHPLADLPRTANNMKVTIEEWHAVASWRWDMPEDEVCGICRVQFDGTCPTCKYPGDDCALCMAFPMIFLAVADAGLTVNGKCGHSFHMVWISFLCPDLMY